MNDKRKIGKTIWEINMIINSNKIMVIKNANKTNENEKWKMQQNFSHLKFIHRFSLIIIR